jgi:glycosyltransferase involved in cell wall biosynthesis
MKPRAILFLPYLAPYRVDVLNELGTYFDLMVIFQFENAPEQNFDQKLLRDKLKINYRFLVSGFNVGTRQFRTGVRKLIWDFKPDVVFSNEFGPTSILLSIYSKLFVPKFVHISTTSDNVKMAKEAKWFRRLARKFVIRNVYGIVVYNEEIAEWYKKFSAKLNVKICPNIQNPDSFLSRKEALKLKAEELKRKYDINGKKVLLYVGRLDAVKNLEKLLILFSRIYTGNEILILVGDGKQKDALVSLSNGLTASHAIFFVGRHDGIDLYSWYSLADIFVLPSTHEPYGAVVNEALIFGIPVICSKYAGASYLIKEKQNGWIVDPSNDEEFEKVLRNAFNNPIENKHGLSNVCVDFHSAVFQYYAIYRESLDRKKII